MTKQPAPITDSRPTLFLDIDDTLCLNNPFTGHHALRALAAGTSETAAPQPSDVWLNLFHRPAVDALNLVMQEHRPRVVITSSWLLHFDDRMLRAVFHRTQLGLVADSFHDHWDAQQDRGMTRLAAITRWVKHHHRGEPLAVIDDTESGTGLRGSSLHKQGHVILCQPGVGLCAEHLPAIGAALAASSARAPRR